MPTVLISSGPLRNQPGPFRDLLLHAGFEPIDPPGIHALTQGELHEYLPRADAVIAGGELYTADILKRCPRLRVIARTGVGYDAIDLTAATAQGVAVTITPGTNHDSVAEQAFALLLGVTRRVALNDRIIRAGGWDRSLVIPLRGRTLGLVGLGRIGRAMVPRARAFGMTVLAYDPVAGASAGALDGAERVDFDELLARSDVVSLHCPLDARTRCWFNRTVFARMKPGAILLNTARGGVVVEADLHAALTTGQLAGAGLDVLDPEPPAPGNPLLALDNVVVSPHIAGIDTQAMADMAEKAAWCVAELHGGRWPADCIVNPTVAEAWRRS